MKTSSGTSSDALSSVWWRALATSVVGAACLAWSVRVPHGSPQFYTLSLGLAVIWIAGAFWVGGVTGRDVRRHNVTLTSVVSAIGIGVLFLIGGYIAARIPVMSEQVGDLLARTGYKFVPPLVLVAGVTGIAEELFFRGALFNLIPSGRPCRRVVISTVVYVLVTASSANLGLIAAAAVLGGMTGAVREYSGSVVPAVVGHAGWTLPTVGALPVLLA